MPAYKANFLPAAIESIIAQTAIDWELVIVDDCSPEPVRATVLRYDDERIRYYRNERNLGGENLVKQWNQTYNQKKEDP